MVSYKELYEQNHRITELSNVLRYLFKDRSMCDTSTSCELFRNYVKLVQEHIDTIDKNMYTDLLKTSDEDTSNVVRNFMSGSIEVKRILTKFSKDWCPAKNTGQIKFKDHGKFTEATDELFDIVLKRILDETEHLYPLARNIKRVA